MSEPSVVTWHSEHEGYRCGYCKLPDSNYSHGMTTYSLTVEDYQDLVDRGWRRSGTYVYKPTMKKTCCPQYSIRCHALEFHLSQSQKKVIKRVNKYLNYGIILGEQTTAEPHRQHDIQHSPRKSGDTHKATGVSIKDSPEEKRTHGSAGSAIPLATFDSDEAADKSADKSSSVACDRIGGKSCHPKPGVGEDPTKPKCKKAKLRRLEKKKLKSEKTNTRESDLLFKAFEKGTTGKGKTCDLKTLEDYLDDVIENPAHTLEIRLVRSSPASDEFLKMRKESYSVYRKYQMTIHEDSAEECCEPMYQGFLVRSPLQQEGGSLPHGYGSFHQLYILDGKVIAVGVIDILPKCVSSVYLYYDPDYSFLSLGTYSALRELAFTRHLHSLSSDIAYYYLGFYIHSCPKMRYKGQYDPSYLLCPETYTWCKLEECQKKLNDQKYCRFAAPGIEDKDGVVDVDAVLVLHKGHAVSYAVYHTMKKSGVSDRSSVGLYARLAGATCAKRILLYRP